MKPQLLECNNQENTKRKRFILFALSEWVSMCMHVLCLHFLGWYFRNVCVCMSLCFRSLIIKYTCTMFILTILISFLFSIVLSFLLSLHLVFIFCEFCSNELQTLSELKPNHTRPSYRMWGKASTYMHVSILHSRSEKYTKLRDDGINWLHFRWFCLFVFVYHSIQSTYKFTHTTRSPFISIVLWQW